MSEYDELKECIKEQGKKIDRILAWAEGDAALGTPSIKDQMNTMSSEIVENRKRTYKNTSEITDVKHDIKTIKKTSGLIGAGSGGIMAGIAEVLKSIFT